MFYSFACWSLAFGQELGSLLERVRRQFGNAGVRPFLRSAPERHKYFPGSSPTGLRQRPRVNRSDNRQTAGPAVLPTRSDGAHAATEQFRSDKGRKGGSSPPPFFSRSVFENCNRRREEADAGVKNSENLRLLTSAATGGMNSQTSPKREIPESL